MKTITRILAVLFACAGFVRAALPTIDTQPLNSTNCVGSAASFAVAASSDSSTNYQWYFNETNSIADATNATYSIGSVSAGSAGGYSVVVTNNDGSVTASSPRSPSIRCRPSRSTRRIYASAAPPR